MRNLLIFSERLVPFPGLGSVHSANPTFNLNFRCHQRSWKLENNFSTRQSNPGELKNIQFRVSLCLEMIQSLLFQLLHSVLLFMRCFLCLHQIRFEICTASLHVEIPKLNTHSGSKLSHLDLATRS